MSTPAEKQLSTVEAYDEKQFYLDEFRGHTVLFSVPASELKREDDYGQLAAVVRELLTNDTRVVIVVPTPESTGESVLRRLQRRLGSLIFQEQTIPLFPQRHTRTAAFAQIDGNCCDTRLLSSMWITLRRGPLFVGVIPGSTAEAGTQFAQQAATRLRVHKWVLMEPQGGVVSTDGKKLSFMDETMLASLLNQGEAEWAGLGARRTTFTAVRAALLGGVNSVNLCTPEGAARELFTYEGSGTLFTLADYCTVQLLGIDDFEEVERLIERGQREGVLKLRSMEQIAAMLVNGYGATIGAHHLAGICALLTEPYEQDRAGEVVGLYTITRFKGEGVAARLIARVLADARARDLAYVFASTTEERAQVFFERQAFRRVAPDDVPATKWVGYDPQRKAVVAVYRFDINRASG